MHPREFARLLELPEGEQVEFKAAKRTYSFDRLAKYVVAIANEGGGTLVLGVTNNRPRRVVGTKAFPEPGKATASLKRRLLHRVRIDEHDHDGKRVLIIHVPSRDAGSAWNDRGTYWHREGEDLVPMADAVLRRIHAETQSDFSAECCVGLTLDELDRECIREFARRWAARSGNSRIAGWSVEHVLRDSELLVHGELTNAALLLFGTGEAVSRRVPDAEIVFEYRSSRRAGPAQERSAFREGFLRFHDQLWQAIDRRNDRQSFQVGFFRGEVSTFDEAGVREAVLNAFCHRDYRLAGSVFVCQYVRSLVVSSPGGFPAGVTLDNMLDRQNPRNRRLAEALTRCGLVERSGQGLNLMYEHAVVQGKPLPDFSETDETQVRVRLDGHVTNPEFLAFVERVGDELMDAFDTSDLLALDYVSREERVPAGLRDRLPHLRSLGVVETVGRGRGTRYILSRKFASALGRAGAYTRRRGLDDETNKELLVRHLTSAGSDGSPMRELQQVLPALSRKQVLRLLKALRSDGRVALRGQRRTARWYAATVAPRRKNGP